ERRADAPARSTQLEPEPRGIRRQYLSKLVRHKRVEMRHESAVHDSGDRSKFEERVRPQLVAGHTASSYAKHVARCQLCRQSRDEIAGLAIHEHTADGPGLLHWIHGGSDCPSGRSRWVVPGNTHHDIDGIKRDSDSGRTATEQQISLLLVHLYCGEPAVFELQRRADHVDATCQPWAFLHARLYAVSCS